MTNYIPILIEPVQIKTLSLETKTQANTQAFDMHDNFPSPSLNFFKLSFNMKITRDRWDEMVEFNFGEFHHKLLKI